MSPLKMFHKLDKYAKSLGGSFLGGWPSFGTEHCTICGTWKMIGNECPKCAVNGKVVCPARIGESGLQHKNTCVLCKGSGFVEELT